MDEMTVTDVITTFPLTDIHAPSTPRPCQPDNAQLSRFFAQIHVSWLLLSDLSG